MRGLLSAWLVIGTVGSALSFGAEGIGSQDADRVNGRKPKPFFRNPWVLGAHRGGGALWPESTVLAFRKAAERWSGIVLESDARLTADRHVVLLHDEKVDRTTNGTGLVSSMTLAEVKALDAGYRFTPDGGTTFPYRGKGLTIPTLAEALRAVPDARWEFETKAGDGIVEKTVAAIRAAKSQDRVLLASFNPTHMTRVRKLAPRIATCYDMISGVHLLQQLRGDGTWESYKPIADCLSLMKHMRSQFKLRPEEIQAIREKGICFQIHTINDRAEMIEMLDLGADSILTDRPDVLAQVVSERKHTRTTSPGKRRSR